MGETDPNAERNGIAKATEGEHHERRRFY